MKKTILGVAILIAVIGSLLIFRHKAAAPAKTNIAVVRSNTSSTPSQTPAFNKQLYPVDKPDSIWVVVNKPRPLQPIDYVPSDLVIPNIPLRVPGNESMQVGKSTASSLEKMFGAAKQDGLNLMLSSGYRSYAYQVNLYNGYVKSQGQAAADTISARPGHSEHQTGFAADIEPTSRKCEVDVCFADTPEGKWLATNAYKYGFIIRYDAEKVAITGYEYEPWHVRYVGIDLATELHNTGIKTLEEFFGVPGGPNY